MLDNNEKTYENTEKTRRTRRTSMNLKFRKQLLINKYFSFVFFFFRKTAIITFFVHVKIIFLCLMERVKKLGFSACGIYPEIFTTVQVEKN